MDKINIGLIDRSQFLENAKGRSQSKQEIPLPILGYKGLVENIGECYKTVEDFKTQLRNVEKALEWDF